MNVMIIYDVNKLKYLTEDNKYEIRRLKSQHKSVKNEKCILNAIFHKFDFKLNFKVYFNVMSVLH